MAGARDEGCGARGAFALGDVGCEVGVGGERSGDGGSGAWVVGCGVGVGDLGRVVFGHVGIYVVVMRSGEDKVGC